MEKIIKKYLLYIIVFLLSFTLSYLVETDSIFKGILALPAVGSLLSFLYKMYRDDRIHERAIELQNKQQDFILGTASHMADVVYDKHAVFCEEYIYRIQSGFQELLRDGPSRNSLDIGRDLVNIRQKHSAWLTKEIEEELKPFEQALIKIGAKESILNHLPEGERRNTIVEEIYKSFDMVIGFTNPLNEEEADIAIDKIIEKIRKILGINILTELRLRASDVALKRIKNI